jgi:hypothetical protein
LKVIPFEINKKFWLRYAKTGNQFFQFGKTWTINLMFAILIAGWSRDDDPAISEVITMGHLPLRPFFVLSP